MERGFYHPDRGYWQTTGDVPESIRADYPDGTREVPVKPGTSYEWTEGEWVFVEPELAPPVEVEPVRIACALRVAVADETVIAVGGSYRVAAMIYLDVGTFLAVFSQGLGTAEPYVIPNNGVAISIAEWGDDYAVLEIRDHAGGSLITPNSFGFSLYNF